MIYQFFVKYSVFCLQFMLVNTIVCSVKDEDKRRFVGQLSKFVVDT